MCLQMCVWMCKEDVEADPERLTHHSLHYPLTTRNVLAALSLPHIADLLIPVFNT